MTAIFPSSRPNISVRVIPKIPATMTGAGGIGVSKENGVWTIHPQWDDLQLIAPGILLDPTTKEVWVHDPVTDIYNRMTLGGLGQALFWGTSNSSNLIGGANPKTWVTQSGKDWAVGTFIQAISNVDPTNFQIGQVVSYVGTQLVVNILTTGGSGTFNDWTIVPSTLPGSGPPGPAGPSSGMDYNFVAELTGDPGGGCIGFSNTSIPAIGEVRISDTDRNFVNILTEITTWDDSTTVNARAKIRVASQDNPQKFVIATITGPVTHLTGYSTIPVTGAVGDFLPDVGPCQVEVYRTGDKGIQGPPGTAGGAVTVAPDRPDPLLAINGQQWFESDTGNSYVFYDDGSSGQWVQVSSGGGISDAPAISRWYSRFNNAWQRVDEIVPLYRSRAAAQAADIPTDVYPLEEHYIRVAGYAHRGDGGEALYKEITAPSPAKPWQFQSVDGKWWQLVPQLKMDARVLGFGATTDGPTNTQALRDCIECAAALGCHEILLPEGGYFISSTVMVQRDGIVIRGRLQASYHDAPGSNLGTFLSWNGPANGKMFEFSPVLGAGKPALSACGLHDVYLYGGNTAGALLRVLSNKFSRFTGLFLTGSVHQGPTNAALEIGVVGSTVTSATDLGEKRDTQNCEFNDLVIVQNTSSANCMVLTGDGFVDDGSGHSLGDGGANVSMNRFANLILRHTSNYGLYLHNADNNDFRQIRVFKDGGSPSNGVVFGAGPHPSITARNNTFHRLYANGGVGVWGTTYGVAPSTDNRIFEYDTLNESPPIVPDSGATINWTNDQTEILAQPNGHFRLSAGFMEHWGLTTIAVTGTPQVVTFSPPFTSGGFNLQVTTSGDGSGPNIPVQGFFSGLGQITLVNPNATPITVFWRAIGR